MMIHRILNFLVVLFIIIAFARYTAAQVQGIPLSLDEAIALALKQNITLQSARDRLTSANISLEAAKSDFQIKIRPEVSGLLRQDQTLDQAYGIQVSKRLKFGSTVQWQTNTYIDESLDNAYQTDVTLSLTQPLLKGRGTLPTMQEQVSAERSVQSQLRSLMLAQQQLMINAASNYYGILRDEMLIEVNQRALERAQLLLQAAEAKLKIGMASKMDVFRAELQVLTSKNGMVDALESLDNMRRQFNLLLGVDLETTFDLTSTLEYHAVEVQKEELLQYALEHRLELQEAADAVQDAERRLKIAKQNLYPPLDLSIQYTFSGEGDAFDQSLDLGEKFWGIGVNSSFHLDFARDRAVHQQAQLSLNSAIRAWEAAQQDVILEVLQTINSVKQAQARGELQKHSVMQAEKQLELSELRYKKGLSDNLDVIDAEEAVLNANTSYYSAIAQHLITQLRLKQAAATLETPF
jgi:outer membrane protein TolC